MIFITSQGLVINPAKNPHTQSKNIKKKNWDFRDWEQIPRSSFLSRSCYQAFSDGFQRGFCFGGPANVCSSSSTSSEPKI